MGTILHNRKRGLEYHVWTETSLAKYARVRKQPEFMLKWKEDHLLNRGVPVAHLIPMVPTFELNPKSGKVIPDYISNTSNLMLVAEELRQYLTEHADAEIEFIPSQVKNHGGRLLKEPFYIANVLGAVSCMDKRRSDIEWSSIDPDCPMCIRRLVLDHKKIPKNAKLFRLANAVGLFLIREDLFRDLFENGPSRGFASAKLPTMEASGAILMMTPDQVLQGRSCRYY